MLFFLRLLHFLCPFFAFCLFRFFFFNDTATTEIYTLSLHDALPICRCTALLNFAGSSNGTMLPSASSRLDRKSTRLNSSHQIISYAVFCLKKKKQIYLISRTAITGYCLKIVPVILPFVIANEHHTEI